MARRPAPLDPGQAKRTLAHRFARRADRLRQLNTRFGLRARRVFLTWTRWSGEERGEGAETVISRIEILPTPRITGSVTRRPWSVGQIPEGQLRVDEISAQVFSSDILLGKRIPILEEGDPAPSAAVSFAGTQPTSDPKVDFYWEVVEDGRGDDPPMRERFSPVGIPERLEGKIYWAVNIERVSEDARRDGLSAVDEEDW